MRKESFEEIGTPENHTFDMVNIPKDVVLGVPIVMITGKNEALVENCKGIIEYSDHIIRLKIKEGHIRINGDHLIITSYRNFDVKIVGYIKSIEYCQ